MAHDSHPTNPFLTIIEYFSKDNNDLIQVAVVDEVDEDQLYIRRRANTMRDERSYPTLAGVDVDVGADVLVLRVSTGYIVLGEIISN